MTADVRAPVQNCEVECSAVNNKIHCIIGGIFCRFTKEAAVLGFLDARIRDVLVSPGTPQSFHDATCTFDPDRRGSPENHNGFSLINSFNSFPALK